MVNSVNNKVQEKALSQQISLEKDIDAVIDEIEVDVQILAEIDAIHAAIEESQSPIEEVETNAGEVGGGASSTVDFLRDGATVLANSAFKTERVELNTAIGQDFIDTNTLLLDDAPTPKTDVNHAPTAIVEIVSVTEDEIVVGEVEFNDIDGTATVAVTDGGITPTGLTLNSDGSYAFDASSYDELGEGETLVLEVPLTVTDDSDATTTTTLKITVTGSNDAPTADAEIISIVENEVLQGTIDFTDIDGTATVAIDEVANIPIGLVLNSDGSYTFDANSYDNLTEGEARVFSVSLTVTDSYGATTPTTLTITVTGSNDAPTVVAASAFVDGGKTVTSRVEFDDIDGTASVAIAEGETIPTGLTLNSDGSYEFDASSYNSLVAGQEKEIIVSLTVTDNEGLTTDSSLTITIIGSSDAPTLTVSAVDNLEANSVIPIDTVVATFSASDEEGFANIFFTEGTNSEGYYAIDLGNNTVVLTLEGKIAVLSGETMPAIDLTAIDANGGEVQADDTPTYSVETSSFNEADVVDNTTFADIANGSELLIGSDSEDNTMWLAVIAENSQTDDGDMSDLANTLDLSDLLHINNENSLNNLLDVDNSDLEMQSVLAEGDISITSDIALDVPDIALAEANNGGDALIINNLLSTDYQEGIFVTDQASVEEQFW